MQITTDEAWAENEPLLTAWIKVLEAVVAKVPTSVVSEEVVAPITELLAHKNPFARRKLGNRMLFSVAKHTGEPFFDTDPQTLKLVLGVCRDGNYKIRRDGVVFFREYFEHDRKQIVEHYRFREVYLPELMEFLNDEDSHIRVDAIEAFAVILEDLDSQELDEFMQGFLKYVVCEEDEQVDIIERIAGMIGDVLYKSRKLEAHLKHKE